MPTHQKRQFFSIITNLAKSLLVILLISYGVFVIGKSIHDNYSINQQIDLLKTQITQLQSDINELQNLIVYYQTDSFKEAEARRRLGVQAPGEQVIILPKPEDRTSQTNGTLSAPVQNQITNTTSDPTKWLQYILGT